MLTDRDVTVWYGYVDSGFEPVIEGLFYKGWASSPREDMLASWMKGNILYFFGDKLDGPGTEAMHFIAKQEMAPPTFRLEPITHPVETGRKEVALTLSFATVGDAIVFRMWYLDMLEGRDIDGRRRPSAKFR